MTECGTLEPLIYYGRPITPERVVEAYKAQGAGLTVGAFVTFRGEQKLCCAVGVMNEVEGRFGFQVDKEAPPTRLTAFYQGFDGLAGAPSLCAEKFPEDYALGARCREAAEAYFAANP